VKITRRRSTAVILFWEPPVFMISKSKSKTIWKALEMSCREKGAMDCLNSWRVAFQLWGATSKNEGHVASGVLKHSNGKLGKHPVNEVVHWNII